MPVMTTINIEKYSLAIRAIHWFCTLAIISLFASGIWMIELDYYSDWYQTAPEAHMLLGFILLGIMCARLLFRAMQPKLPPLPSLKPYEVLSAHAVHIALYLLTFVILISGVLIAFAGDETVNILGLFDLPDVGSFFEQQQDISGLVHEWAAWLVIIVSAVHALAALKHHFIDRDVTLQRML